MAQHFVDRLPDSLERILVVLWRCLSDMKDDLSSSVGAVMDLLGMKPYIGKIKLHRVLIHVYRKVGRIR